jgi:hypothetical protein
VVNFTIYARGHRHPIFDHHYCTKVLISYHVYIDISHIMCICSCLPVLYKGIICHSISHWYHIIVYVISVLLRLHACPRSHIISVCRFFLSFSAFRPRPNLLPLVTIPCITSPFFSPLSVFHPYHPNPPTESPTPPARTEPSTPLIRPPFTGAPVCIHPNWAAISFDIPITSHFRPSPPFAP